MESQPAGATPLQQLESFEALLGVHVTLYDFGQYFQIAGQRILAEKYGAHDRCSYCHVVKDEFGRLRDCMRCDMEPVVMRSRGPAAWRRCHAGVWEVVYPLWEGGTFIGALMAGCFRRAGEQPLIELPVVKAESGRKSSRGQKDRAAWTALRQHHRALRDLDPVMESRLPALVENFALGLVRSMAQLRRQETGHAGTAASDAGGTTGVGEAAGSTTPRQERLRTIELYFRTHLAQGTNIAGLAAHLYLSVARTSQILRREMHTTFPAMLRRTRLAEARRLLTVSEMPIGRIAELAGFEDRNYFCRVFTRELSLTPSEYRRQNARPLRA